MEKRKCRAQRLSTFSPPWVVRLWWLSPSCCLVIMNFTLLDCQTKETLANEHAVGTCQNRHIEVGKWTKLVKAGSQVGKSRITNHFQCSALFIWKYEQAVHEINRSNYVSAFQTHHHHFPTQTFCFIRVNEILNSSPSSTPCLKGVTREYFQMCDIVILFCDLQDFRFVIL